MNQIESEHIDSIIELSSSSSSSDIEFIDEYVCIDIETEITKCKKQRIEIENTSYSCDVSFSHILSKCSMPESQVTNERNQTTVIIQKPTSNENYEKDFESLSRSWYDDQQPGPSAEYAPKKLISVTDLNHLSPDGDSEEHKLVIDTSDANTSDSSGKSF